MSADLQSICRQALRLDPDPPATVPPWASPDAGAATHQLNRLLGLIRDIPSFATLTEARTALDANEEWQALRERFPRHLTAVRGFDLFRMVLLLLELAQVSTWEQTARDERSRKRKADRPVRLRESGRSTVAKLMRLMEDLSPADLGMSNEEWMTYTRLNAKALRALESAPSSARGADNPHLQWMARQLREAFRLDDSALVIEAAEGVRHIIRTEIDLTTARRYMESAG